jgi:hypothetical protein
MIKDMVPVPKIKLSIDIHKISRYIQIDERFLNDAGEEMIIGRDHFDQIVSLLRGYDINDEMVIREFCFIILWISHETRADRCTDRQKGNFYLMWKELDGLRHYLMTHRVTAVSLRGEFERDKEGEEFIMNDPINIDRVCDGLRSVFREEFSHDQKKRRSKGLTAWQKRKMIQVRNQVLNYFSSIPILDDLPMDETTQLIDKLEAIALQGSR